MKIEGDFIEHEDAILYLSGVCRISKVEWNYMKCEPHSFQVHLDYLSGGHFGLSFLTKEERDECYEAIAKHLGFRREEARPLGFSGEESHEESEQGQE